MTTLAPVPGQGIGPEDEGDDGSGHHDDVVAVPDRPAPSSAGSRPATGTVKLTGHWPNSGPTDTARLTGHRLNTATTVTVDLTRRGPKPPVSDPAALASWVFGLALSLLSEGTAEPAVVAEVLAEAAGRSRAIEGAYGRAVALLSEFPGDPLVHLTVDVLAKALLRSRRPSRAAEEA